MTVVVEKPYQFVPPHRGELWPSLIQRFRLVDFYLKRKEGVVSYECRHLDRLRRSLEQDLGVVLAPNHCRYADPLVLGWLSRESHRHVYAMASWHLFNKSRFDRFSIPKMGGFSIWREGLDRQSLETAIGIIDEGRRPLIIFPEGTTNRTNDRLQPLLDGVPFIARSAAKRRIKADKGPVVVHPVGIKYLYRGDIQDWACRAMSELESRLSWKQHTGEPVLVRITRLAEGLLSLKEVEYLGRAQSGSLHERRTQLIEHLLELAEGELECPAAGGPQGARDTGARDTGAQDTGAQDTGARDTLGRQDTAPGQSPPGQSALGQSALGQSALGQSVPGQSVPGQSALGRVRTCRSRLVARLLDANTSEAEKVHLRQVGRAAELAQQLFSYPLDYLDPEQVTDTRVLETLQRMQEDFLGKVHSPAPLHAVMEVDEPIEVDDQRPPRGTRDPLLVQLERQLEGLLTRLSSEANRLPASELIVP